MVKGDGFENVVKRVLAAERRVLVLHVELGVREGMRQRAGTLHFFADQSQSDVLTAARHAHDDAEQRHWATRSDKARRRTILRGDTDLHRFDVGQLELLDDEFFQRLHSYLAGRAQYSLVERIQRRRTVCIMHNEAHTRAHTQNTRTVEPDVAARQENVTRNFFASATKK